MDLSLAVEINRKKLAGVVATLFAMVGNVGIIPVQSVQRWVHLAVLEMLRPAESAARRLVAVLAHAMTIPAAVRRSVPTGIEPTGKDTVRVPVFGLFDPRKRIGPFERKVPGYGPGIRSFYGLQLRPSETQAIDSRDPVNAARLCKRLLALHHAIDDLPAQARRLARILAAGKSKFLQVMRPGRPPGHRARRRFEVDDLLADCHDLALYALNPPAPP